MNRTKSGILFNENITSNERLKENAIKEFGITPHFHQAGYMLDDGTYLNFANPGDISPEYQRGTDHGAIQNIYEHKLNNIDEYVNDFIKRGNIRIRPENWAIQFYKKPTEAQMRTIIREFKDGNIGTFELMGDDGRPKQFIEANNIGDLIEFFNKMK